MKKTILVILGISLILFVYSCANDNTNDNNDNQDTTENVVVDDNNNVIDNTDQPAVNNFAEGTLEIADIKVGDKINGLTVASIDHQQGEYFSIMLDGEFQISGNLQLNPMDEIPELFLENADVPPITIKAEGNEYPFLKSLEFKNGADLVNALSTDQLSTYQGGGIVKINITVKNLSTGAYIPGGKGKIGSGAVDFVKLN